MTYYWRLKDIPELRDVPKKDRRKWWREAVTRNQTGWSVTTLLAIYVGCMLGVEVIGARLGYRSGLAHFGFVFVGILLATFAADRWVMQPRARAWLHARLNGKDNIGTR